MERKQMVLSAIGPDRPGLVKNLSSAIFEAGGNIEDSRMAILAGDFAVIVLYSATAEANAKVESRAKEIERELSFQIRIKPATPAPGGKKLAAYRLEITGLDRPGIVHRTSAVLADLGVNVASLDSKLITAAFAGTPMFELRAELQISSGSSVEQLFEHVEKICEELDLSYDLTPVQDKLVS